MKKEFWIESMMAFFVCTACICILEGIMGVIFMPDLQLDYGAFFSPPLFGLLSVVFGLITESKKELSVRQVLVRRGIHLALIEGMVFGINYLTGNIFEPVVAVVLALAIAVVFVMVYVVLYVNDSRNAKVFNEKLKEYQSGVRRGEKGR